MTLANEAVSQKSRASGVIVSNSMTMLTRQVILWGLNAVLVLFLPRYLGDTGLGQVQFAVSFAALLSVAVGLGSRQFLIKAVARDTSLASPYLGAAIGIRLLVSPVVLGAAVGAVRFLGYGADAEGVVYVATLTMVVTSFANLMMAVLNGLEDMAAPAAAEIAGKVLVILVGVPALVLGFGVMGYALVLLLSAVVQLGVTAALLFRRVPLGVSFHVPHVKALLVGGAPFLLMGILLTAYNNIDVVMLRAFTNAATVGWYAAATSLLRIAEVIPLALTTALLPTMAKAHAEEPDALASIARKSLIVGTLVSVPLAAGLGALSTDVIAFLPYPDSFRNSVPLLTILALGTPVTALLVILGTIAIAVDRQKLWAVALLVTVLMNVALNAVAIPFSYAHYGNGAIGASVATVLCEGAMVAIGVRLMPKGALDASAWRTLLKVVLAGLGMVAVSLAARRLGLDLLPLVGLAGVAYVALVFALRTATREDLAGIWEVASRRIRSLPGMGTRRGGPP